MAQILIDKLLQACVKQGASDIHIVVGQPPVLVLKCVLLFLFFGSSPSKELRLESLETSLLLFLTGVTLMLFSLE